MIGPDKLQYSVAQFGQAQPFFSAMAFRLPHGMLHAALMIMIGSWEWLMLSG
jgi:hypothetical protein